MTFTSKFVFHSRTALALFACALALVGCHKGGEVTGASGGAASSDGASSPAASSSGPKEQLNRYFAALKTLDFKTLYETTQMDDKQFPNEQAFLDKMNAEIGKQPQAKQLMQMAFSMVTFSAGEPTITGSTAMVPVTTTFTLGGQSQKDTKTITMVKVGDTWKVSREGNKGLGAGMFGGGGQPGAGGPGMGRPNGSPPGGSGASQPGGM